MSIVTAASPYALNPQLQPQILQLGAEQCPVLVLDQLLADASALVQQARQSQFSDVRSYLYPGVRAALPKDYVLELLQALSPLVRQLYQIPPALKVQAGDCSFSLITKAPAELKPMQRLPHFDTTEPYVFALLHYLDGGEHGGTGFFRQRSTGIDRVSAANKELYFSSLQQFVDANGLDEGYIRQGNEHFELYQALDYQPNRLLLYPGNLLHSGLVNPATDVSAAIPGGRLTANLFIRFSD